MSGGITLRHAQNPLSGKRRKTLSITHHAPSPPPSHHHLYIIHLINWLQRFYRIIMSHKRPFVPKSDVKQWFTTTTFSKEHTYSDRIIQTYLKNDLTGSQERGVCVSTAHLLASWKFSFVVCALSEWWWFWAQCFGWIVSLVFSVWPHHFLQMVTESCKWLSDVVFCTFWYFRCSTVYL